MLRNYELSWDAYPKAAPMSNYPSTDYFCIHVLVTPAQVSLIDLFSKQGYPLPSTDSIEYSFNKSEWFTYSGPINVTDHVYFRGSPVLPDTNTVSWGAYGGARGFVVNVPFYVSGKISSLIDKYLTGNVNNPRYGFNNLFATASAGMYLYNAEYLQLDYAEAELYGQDADDINIYGIYESMFGGCEHLLKAPQIQAIRMGSFACRYMFHDCIKLTVAPDLLATRLARGCYSDMFNACSALTTPAKMPSSVDCIGATAHTNLFDYMYWWNPSLQYMPRLPLINISGSQVVHYEYPADKMVDHSGVTISNTQSQETSYLFRMPASGTQLGVDMLTNINGETSIDINTDYYCNLPMLPTE